MQDGNQSETPAENHFESAKATDDEHPVDISLYKSLIGSLY